MKRSNRLVLLIGIFLAVVAFVGVLAISQGGGTATVDPNAPKTELPTVIAIADIPLGTAIRAEQVQVQVKPVEARDADAFGDVSQVIGLVARQAVAKGAAVTGRTLALTGGGTVVDVKVPAGQRAMSVRVNQESGVGTIIKTADFVDLLVSFTDANFPLTVPAPSGVPALDVGGLGPNGAELYNPTSTKLILQGMQVLGTLLPRVEAAAAPAPTASAAPGGQGGTGAGSGTVLAEQGDAIVILSVTPQQAEVIKWAQIDGSISLTLRSPEDFVDPATGQPLTPP